LRTSLTLGLFRILVYRGPDYTGLWVTEGSVYTRFWFTVVRWFG